MSYNGKKSFNSGKFAEQKKIGCNICMKAGLIEESTTHNAFDGNTCCPTLAKFKCRYCDKLGHTVKFCPEKKIDDECDAWRKNFQADMKRQQKKEQEQGKKEEQKKLTTKSTNTFDEESSDDDEDLELLLDKYETDCIDRCESWR